RSERQRQQRFNKKANDMGSMAAIGGAEAGAGALMHIAGTYLAAKEADKRRKELERIVNTPGVDIGAATGEALNAEERYLPQASRVQAEVSAANQAAMLAQEEAALPGVEAARAQALDRIKGLFSEDSAFIRDLQGRAAAWGLGSGGYGAGGSD